MQCHENHAKMMSGNKKKMEWCSFFVKIYHMTLHTFQIIEWLHGVVVSVTGQEASHHWLVWVPHPASLYL